MKQDAVTKSADREERRAPVSAKRATGAASKKKPAGLASSSSKANRKAAPKKPAGRASAKGGKKKGRKARQRRNRRILAAILAVAVVGVAVFARREAPALSSLVLGISAALLAMDCTLLALRRGLNKAIYALVGLLALALLLAAPACRDYVRYKGEYVPQGALATSLKVTDRYPAYIEKMDQLETLDMQNSTVTDFQPIASLTALRQLDMRGNYAFSQANHDALQQALPNCEIHWSQPLAGTYVDSDVTDVDLTGKTMTAEEIRQTLEAHPEKAFSYEVTLMDHRYGVDTQTMDLRNASSIDPAEIDSALELLTQVREIDLRGTPVPVETIAALEEAHPEIHFLFSCQVPSGEMTTEDETVVISGGTAQDVLAYAAFIPYMPNLQSMDARAITFSDEELVAIQADPNSGKLLYSFTAFGKTLTTQDTELNLDNVPMTDTAEVERVIRAMPGLTKISMCNTGLPAKQMAALCDAHPEVFFVWWVHFGNYNLRTDASAFSTLLYDNNSYHYTSGTFVALQYCRELQMLDLGHCEITSIQGLANLKKLKVLILADNKITDLSPLAGLEELEYVELFLNKISDLSPLANKTKLLDLNLYYNPKLTDLSPLASCTALERVWVGECGLPDWQINALRKALPKAKVYAAGGGSTDGGWRDHKRYKVIKAMYQKRTYIPFS